MKVSSQCKDRCQYAVDVGMYPEHRCFGECQYRKAEQAEFRSRVWGVVCVLVMVMIAAAIAAYGLGGPKV